jgi:hypothetical protein
MLTLIPGVSWTWAKAVWLLQGIVGTLRDTGPLMTSSDITKCWFERESDDETRPLHETAKHLRTHTGLRWRLMTGRIPLS